MFSAPAAAVTRLQDRGLFMLSTEPSATTSYTLSYQYLSPDPVGSVDMLFCMDPIPYMPCDPPAGLDVSHAVLSNQTGDTGFSILSQSTNHIILTRTPTSPTAAGNSSYTFDNVMNPSDTSTAFAIRLKTLGTTDGTGPQIDVGSVRGQATNAIMLETQVPPLLVFCVAEQVADDCSSTSDSYYKDMGTLGPQSTLTAQSQMAVGTNASGGFTITANGPPMAAGTHVVDSPLTPTASEQGTNQFGINLVANTAPAIGNDPEGASTNAVVSPGYGVPNEYKFSSGDVVAYAPNVSLIKKFTVSYIVNSSKDLGPGVYSTTITYIGSGRF